MSLGFVGGGRVARILIGGWQGSLDQIWVSDRDGVVLEALEQQFPGIHCCGADYAIPAQQAWVFLGLHPPVLGALLPDLAPFLGGGTVVSLAPKLTCAQLSQGLGGYERVLRMIPNAPAIINQGYNPICFGSGIPISDQAGILTFLGGWGACPVVPEPHLEAYVTLTAVGPTYFWFQWHELLSLAQQWGIPEPAAKQGLQAMVAGSLNLLLDSPYAPEEVMDLVVVKPLRDHEPSLRALYRQEVTALYERIRPS